MTLVYSALFAAALLALVLTVVSVFFLGKRGPWNSMWTFFLVLFLTLCTVAIYITPIGPVYWGIAWIPMAIAGIIVTILLIAAMPHPTHQRDPANTHTNTSGTDVKSGFSATSVGRFFWVLIILLVMAIIIGMINPRAAL